MEPKHAKSLDWSVIEAALPPGWRELAVQMKLIRPNLPKHMGTKVTEIGQVLRLVLYQVATNSGLELSTAVFAAAGLLTLSFVALHKWMKKLAPYLERLLAQMVMGEHAVFAPERWAGYELVIADASAVCRPGAKQTTARVHFALRLTDLRAVEVHVTDNTEGETLRRFHPDAGQLWLLDRVYANPPGVGWAVHRKADVLVRYNRGALPLYDRRGCPLDVADCTRKLRKPGRARDWEAFVHLDDGTKIRGRLCAVRLPQDKVEQAKDRIRREQGADATDETMAMAAFVLVFTTVPRARMVCDVVLALYRARWQVELDFKRSKSLTGLDRLPNFLPETIASWIYAKLLLHQVLRKLSNLGSVDAFSPGAVEAVAAACLEPQKQAA
jgi:hypothetical protein